MDQQTAERIASALERIAQELSGLGMESASDDELARRVLRGQRERARR